MRNFIKPRLWLGVWAVGWVLCVVLSLIHPPQIGLDVPDGDKVGHFLAYATLSGWSVLMFANPRSRGYAALALMLLGVAMELAQGAFTTDRMMDVYDALANALGVLAGQGLALSRWQYLLQRTDQRWFGMRK